VVRLYLTIDDQSGVTGVAKSNLAISESCNKKIRASGEPLCPVTLPLSSFRAAGYFHFRLLNHHPQNYPSAASDKVANIEYQLSAFNKATAIV
jgi:hypothetical protein